MITINNLYKKFNKKKIFENFNLNIPEKGIYRITGNNGIGKSTLLKIISGIEKFDNGEVKWKDEGYFSKIGYMFDFPLYIEELSFIDNLNFLSEIQKLETNFSKQRISYLIKLFDLPIDSTPLMKYSSGMKKKVEICMSILNNPDYLIWDEPFNYLDMESIRIVNEEILSKISLALIVTHNEEYIKNDFINISILNNDL